MADYAKQLGPLFVGDRPLPNSVEAERAVISCLLQDPDGTLDTAFARLKTEECFYQGDLRKIYVCLREMRGDMAASRIDLITLSDALVKRQLLDDVGGLEKLNQLYGVVPTSANLDNYLTLLLDVYILRRLIQTCGDIASRCFNNDGSSVEDLIDTVEQEILSVTEMQVDTQVKSIRELIKPAVSYLEELSKNDRSAVGVQTGYPDLDRLITGFRPGDMIVLAARPSIGKTTFAMNVARNVALEARQPVGVFSLEMGSTQVVVRLLCSEARIDVKDLRDGRLSNAQWRQELMPAADRLYNSPIFIDDTPQITSLELRQKARRMHQEHGVRMLVIDYLQLMRPAGSGKNTNREQEVARLSSDIKSLAKELQIPIMILCQLNRQAEQSGGAPKLSHLRESGAIEQDADMVILLHRDREVETGISREEILQNGIESDLIVAKNRNGETGKVSLVFLPHYTRFESRTRFDDDDVPHRGG